MSHDGLVVQFEVLAHLVLGHGSDALREALELDRGFVREEREVLADPRPRLNPRRIRLRVRRLFEQALNLPPNALARTRSEVLFI